MTIDRLAVYDLFARYGALLDAGRYDDWLGLFAEACRYEIMPRENHDRGLPAGLVFCDSRAMLADRLLALREANKYNIHTDRHLIGLPRLVEGGPEGLLVEAPFAVFQSDQEGASRLFAAGLYRDRLDPRTLAIADKLVILDTFAVPTLLATPL